jgi:hypothetical protein
MSLPNYPCEGPYSHAYEAFLVVVRKNELEHPELYELRNERFKQEFGIELPPLPEKYAHEKTSLMMVDFSLAILGMCSPTKLDIISLAICLCNIVYFALY